jgi:putative peptidoglycan lipid II flippase
MVSRLLEKGKKIISSPQNSVLSAATLIMFMVIASRILGLVRHRVLAHFFAAEEISLFFAAFRLPDTIFEVLVFGTFSSAFIPVFTKALKKDESEAWRTAGIVANIGLIIFISFALILSFSAKNIYSIIAPGFGLQEREVIVGIVRILFSAQVFFVLSYVLTGVLESQRRFLVPALAPIFYNLGIIFGTVFLNSRYGIIAPATGVLIGAFMHFAIQIPLSVKLGFRPIASLKPNADVAKIGKLALPRIIEVSFLQLSKSLELYFASLISLASYTYYNFANSIQLLPIGLFGTSISKAALPTLSALSEDRHKFKETMMSAIYQMTFLVLPVATFLIVLRVPIVRLVFGTEIFGWDATIQTGYTVSAFAVSIAFQAATSLLSRSFYALQDTKTPVKVSIFSMFVTVLINFVLIKIFKYPVWGLALGFSVGSIFQSSILFMLVHKKLEYRIKISDLLPIIKLAFSSFVTGLTMYIILKLFDRSVWVKRLSFLTQLDAVKDLPFQGFVLDTRYTFNLIILTCVVVIVGVFVYVAMAVVLKSKELFVFLNLVGRFFTKKKVGSIPAKESEPVTPTTTETSF